MLISTASKILELLLRKKTSSRAELARILGISRPAVSAVTDTLLRNGLAAETGTGCSGGGKPPVLLSINPDAFSVIGIDIGNETVLRGILCNAVGDSRMEFELEFHSSYEDIFAKTVALIRKLKRKASAPVAGIGVAISGIVDTSQNAVLKSANFPFENRNFAESLSEAFSLPVILGNRSRLAAEYESCFGVAAASRDFICVSFGKSIGSTIYQDGKVFDGFHGAAGEIRSFPVRAGGKDIPLEQTLSESFLLKKTPFRSTGELIRAWENGDPRACAIREFILRTMVSVFSILCDFADPELLVLGGRFRQFGEAFRADFHEALNRSAPALTGERRVEFSARGESASLYGAALSAVKQKFQQS